MHGDGADRLRLRGLRGRSAASDGTGPVAERTAGLGRLERSAPLKDRDARRIAAWNPRTACRIRLNARVARHMSPGPPGAAGGARRPSASHAGTSSDTADIRKLRI